MKSYFYDCPRGFANEYAVCIATNAAASKQYEAECYERITRDRAIRELRDRGDAATKVYVRVEVDGKGCERSRFEIARALRKGRSF